MSLLRRPRGWAVLLTLAGVLLFLRLGVWQLHRADEKEALLRRYAAAAEQPVREFAAADAAPPAVDVLPHVRVRGEYLPGREYLLDNPRHDQRGGVEVYAPFHPQGTERLLLVDLGFLAGNGTDQTPQLPPLPGGTVELTGFYQPPPGVGFEMGGDALARQKNWPKTSINLELGDVAKDLGTSLYPRVLALEAEPASIYTREHTPDFSAMPPARHRAYAFQWFTFAVVAVVMFLFLHRKRKAQRGDLR